MTMARSFSSSYEESRKRFNKTANAHAWEQHSYPIGQFGPTGEALSIDVAIKGPTDAAHTIVASSALHGVEGYLGAAVQLDLLERFAKDTGLPKHTRMVLIHALNPYGFAWTRRVNENNIDLNRNFLLDGESYQGSPDKYADLNALLNPSSPPSEHEFFLIKAAMNIARHGMPALKEAVAGGQFDFPQGLFFGGHDASATKQILETHLGTWIADSKTITHVDFHTGLGDWGTYKLLVSAQEHSPEALRIATHFGAGVVEPWTSSNGVSYQIRGGLGSWCSATFADRSYNLLTAEFGTVPVLQVLAALRNENRAHHYGRRTNPATHLAKDDLRDVFAPSQRSWREVTLRRGLRIVGQALDFVPAR